MTYVKITTNSSKQISYSLRGIHEKDNNGIKYSIGNRKERRKYMKEEKSYKRR